jgi:hypothetical protein
LRLLPFSASNKEFATATIVSENYFSVLGIAAMRGRTFGDVSELAASPTVLISDLGLNSCTFEERLHLTAIKAFRAFGWSVEFCVERA